ncbi:hypothetical protein Y032_0112g280 [Ancylostoma ceylanicum]|uniref:Uncharacterized protein n=1 Tax=Ancylostoma ceylanicum TaxID=53326 RepID=A0A016TDU5_9BILA|nr:hypothetical protein Y032_0112g280 [Ancylostoma ceylanicum]
MPEEEKTVTIKFYTDDAPQMTIKYKDKKELFKKFQKKLKKFDFPTDELYWYDWENVHLRIRNADDLYIAVRESDFAKMFARDPRNRKTFPSFSSDEDEKEPDEKEVAKEHKSRNCSPSPTRGRGRSRSEPRHGSRHHTDYFYYPTPWNYGPWMEPRYGFMPCPYDPRGYGMDRRGRQDVKPHCHCKKRHGDAEKP